MQFCVAVFFVGTNLRGLEQEGDCATITLLSVVSVR